MKKSYLFFVILSFLVFSLVGVSHGWQGRMGGMGDPYGLVSDESDFLIHPAKIAKGKGVRFYGDYRFTYTGVTDWDYDLDQFTPAGILTDYYNFDTSGQEYAHDALVGAAFSLGPGRMGLFVQYAALRGAYDGDNETSSAPGLYPYEFETDLDDVAVRLIYGMPVRGTTLGGEFQVAYHVEQNASSLWRSDLIEAYINYPISWPAINLYPFMFAGDWQYWEALFKGSVEGRVGPAHVAFTARGGWILTGNSSFEPERQFPAGTTLLYADLDGDVEGWRIGGELWGSYPLRDTLSLPFVVRLDYRERDREGDGINTSGFYDAYELREEALELEAGGGVEREFGGGSRVAAGLYYSYLDGRTAYRFWDGPSAYDYDDYPARIEHRVRVRLAGERELSPMVVLRMGMNCFYGWVREDFTFTSGATDDISLDGYHWGVGASLGGTIKFKSITLEPFVNAGWQQIKLNGDGETTLSNGTIGNLWEMDKLKKEWSIGGGLSIKFN